MVKILYLLLVCILNILTIHVLLTRIKSIIYAMSVFILNTLVVFGIALLVKNNVQNQIIVEYTAAFIGFLYIVYIYLVFSESVSKKIFTMISIWLFSLIAFLIANPLGKLFSSTIDFNIQNLIYMLRNCIQILFLFATYFWLSKPYKKVLGIVPDRIIYFMSLYPVMAFLMFKTTSFVRVENLKSIYDMLLFLIFIVLGYLLVFAGISASSKVELQNYMANYDSVTGIVNRANIMEQLRKTIESSNRSKLKFALLIFDLDEFKQINDEYGHLIGDKALKHVAQAVQKVLRETDSIGRFGGDEFVIIQQYIKHERDVETLINKIFEELKTPPIIENNKIPINVSFGISIFPDYTSNLELLINQADSAMYEAKKREGSTFNIFESPSFSPVAIPPAIGGLVGKN